VAVGVNIVSSFDARGIEKAIKDFKRLQTGSEKAAYTLRTVDKAAMSLTKSVGKVAAIGGAVAGVMSKTLVNAASNLQESINKVGAVFGSSSTDIVQWSETTAKSLGISQRAALEAAGTYGNLFQAFGLSAPAAKEMSINLVQLAADMASFNNVPIDDALYALRAGLSGESEPLKRFGVALNDTMLKEQALRMGLIETTKGVLPQAIKTQAAYGLVLEQTKIQQGDVERTSSGLAFQMKTLGAQFEDVKAKVGTALIPAFTAFTGVMTTKVIPVLTNTTALIGKEGLGAGIEYFIGASVSGVNKAGPFVKTIVAMGAALVTLRIATVTYTATSAALTIATKVATGAFAAFLTTINATKVALATAGVITAVIAAAGIAYSVYAGKKSEATKATLDFTNALKLEGQAQQDALLEVARADPKFASYVTSLNSVGITMADVSQFVDGGTGALRGYYDAAVEAESITDDTEKVLALFAERVGLNADMTDKANKQYVTGLYRAVVAMSRHRTASWGDYQAQIALALSLGDVARAAELKAKSLGMYGPYLSETQQGSSALDDELKRLTGTMGKGSSAVGRASKTIESFKDRLDKVKQASESFRDAQDRVTSSIKSVTNAQEAYATASDRVAVAQKRFQQVVSGYGADSDQAKQSLLGLNAAQRSAERSGYQYEQSLFAVAEAERELAAMRRDPTSTAQQRREAEIRLAEARLSVGEAADAQTVATQELTAAQQRHDETVSGAVAGSSVYDEALQELNDALKEQRDAHDRVTEAIKDQEDATRKLMEAEQELFEMRKKYPKAADEYDRTSGVVPPAQPMEVTPGTATPLEFPNFMSAVRAQHPNSPALRSATPVSDARRQFPNLYRQYREAGLALADGGVVTEPTTALIGEAGPEAIIPLSRMSGMGEQNITININSTIADETLPDKIVQALQTYNRRVGPVRVLVRS
jgi:hypothetical protein